MKPLHLTSCLLLLLWQASPLAAQLSARPLPADRPIGIVLKSEVGRTTGNTRQEDELTQAAVAEVEQTLRRLGYRVIPRAEVVQKLVDSGINCRAGVLACEPADVLNTLQLGAVALVAIWWDRNPADVTIEITTADSVGAAKGALDGDIAKRVPALVTAALQDVQSGKAVEVQINTLPIGAEVRLDGELIGNAPVSAKARPGSHEVILSYPDYVTTSQHFEVPRGTEEPFPVHVSMERTAASASRTADVGVPRRATRAWDDLLGTGLAVAGVALVTSPLITLARSGDCTDTNDSSCQQVHFGWRSGLQLAGGVLALSGAVVIFATTPIRASLSTNGEIVHVQLRGSF